MKRWKSSSKKASKGAQRDERQRVHLVVLRDESGATRVSLSPSPFQHAWQNQLANQAAQDASALLDHAPLSQDLASQAALSAEAAHERFVTDLFTRFPEARVACKAGCAHCCYQSVGVTPNEAIAIYVHITQQLEADTRETLLQQVRAARVRTRGLNSEQRYSPKHPCPLLNDGNCSVYSVRPLSCRGANSLDAEECRASLWDPEARARFVRQGGGQSYLEPIRAFHALSAGMQLAFAESKGLDMRPLDLVAALDLLLSEAGPTLIADWLAGKRAFATAYGGERQLF